MNQTIVIRADASTRIGSGHIMRCLTLADALVSRGGTVHFICRPFPGHLTDLIQARGYSVTLLPELPLQNLSNSTSSDTEPPHAHWLGCPWQQDAEETLAALETVVLPNIDWLVVDHYALDARWHRMLRSAVNRIMVIDDLADRLHDCDLLLDQTYGRKAQEYWSWVPSRCRLLLGGEYALLRSEFAAIRSNILQRRKACYTIQRIMVSMGGMDPDNITGKVLNALLSLISSTITVDVVLNANAPHLSAVSKYCSKQPTIRLHVDAHNMAELMSQADLAIGAAGATSWERACLGLPSCLLITADNQRFVAQSLTNAGAAYLLGDGRLLSTAEIRNELARILPDLESLRRLSENSAKLIDGLGSARTVARMEAPASS